MSGQSPFELAEDWLALDQDEETRSEICTLVKEGESEALMSLLGQRISFGTAGLRAQMGAGFARINPLIVIQTSQGLAEHLLQTLPDARSMGVVIGHDSRHNSVKFALHAAMAFLHKDIKVWWYEKLVHTPLVPFAVKSLRAAGGVMITASHNPAKDNGYKVYAANGCQIVAPADTMIAQCISENLKPETWEVTRTSPLMVDIHSQMSEKYRRTVKEYFGTTPLKSVPRFVYTPMHGVGLPYFEHMLKDLNDCDFQATGNTLKAMTTVGPQREPDPNFPTVKYPNPEEDGALDLAKIEADKHGIDLILANDPDADRFAAAERVDGRWHQFTGDQVGVLLGYYVLTNQIHHLPSKKDFMLTTAVSSSMLSCISSSLGFSVEETLTGFKWLGNRALALQPAINPITMRQRQVHFAYEEALGYMFPSIVHDKDGIVAAGIFLKNCAWGGSPYKQLQELYEQYGYFENMNTYWRSPNVETTLAVFGRIQKKYPGKEEGGSLHVAGRPCTRWRDLSTGFDSAGARSQGALEGGEEPTSHLPSSPDTLMVTCWLAPSAGSEGARFTIRASGTEPKIKVYLECWGKDPFDTKKDAEAILTSLKRDWFTDESLKLEEKYAYL